MTQHIESDLQARKPGEYLLQELEWVHNALRQDLALCRELAGQVATGVAPEYVHEQVKSLQTSSPLWKLRVIGESRVVLEAGSVLLAPLCDNTRKKEG